MNEKVKQLAKQAYEDVISNTPSMLVTREMFEQKFAELIVKECIQVSGPEDSYTDEWFKAKADSVAKIRKHFGVK